MRVGVVVAVGKATETLENISRLQATEKPQISAMHTATKYIVELRRKDTRHSMKGV